MHENYKYLSVILNSLPLVVVVRREFCTIFAAVIEPM